MNLKYPITVGDKQIASLTFRRPKAKDMIVLGDHMGALAAHDGEEGGPKGGMSTALMTAMVAVVGVLSDIGEEAAGELDFADLTVAATEAMSSLGEADGSDGKEAPGA